MNKVAQIIVKLLVKKNFLDKNRNEEYVYVVEIVMEKMFSYATLLMLALLFNNIVQTIIFLVFFMSMRGRTGGFHMETYKTCWVLTVIIYLLISFIAVPFLYNKGMYSYWIFSIAILIILIISTVNHPNMQLSNLEYKDAKKVARFTAGIHWILLTVLYWGLPNSPCILWAMIADILCAVLLVIAKMFKQEVI